MPVEVFQANPTGSISSRQTQNTLRDYTLHPIWHGNDLGSPWMSRSRGEGRLGCFACPVTVPPRPRPGDAAEMGGFECLLPHFCLNVNSLGFCRRLCSGATQFKSDLCLCYNGNFSGDDALYWTINQHHSVQYCPCCIINHSDNYCKSHMNLQISKEIWSRNILFNEVK